MKDYLVEVKIKNNYLFSRMEKKGLKSLAELSRLVELTNITQLSLLANLKLTPLTSNGDIREVFIKIAKALDCEPLDLIPPQHIDNILVKNKHEKLMDLEELESFDELEFTPSDFNLLEDYSKKEQYQELENGIDELGENERQVMVLRYGLKGNDEHTLEEISDVIGVSSERIRQIEAKALKKLRHPSRLENVRSYYES